MVAVRDVDPSILDESPSVRAAVFRARQEENDWSHPRRPDLDDGTLQACEDPHCRYCRGADGKVRGGFVP